jgi:hypothetical protein
MPQRITKREFYLNGGFSNPRQFRKMVAGKWCYYATP